MRRKGTGRHGARALGAAIAAVLGAGALAAPAGAATIFDPGEKIGKFKVTGGHFQQVVNYLASYRHETGDGCWVYSFDDRGDADFDMTFDRVGVTLLKYKDGIVEFDVPLTFSGRVERTWSGDVSTQAGPNYDEEDCPPANPPRESGTDCGSETFSEVRTPLDLVPVKGGKYSPKGEDVDLLGAIFSPMGHPLQRCPSDSVYSSLPLGAPSPNGMRELDRVKRGQTVRLGGNNTHSGPGPEGFNPPFDWTAGSQTVTYDWLLKLKRVK